MRIIGFLVKSFLILVVLAGLVFLVGREARLMWGLSKLNQSVMALNQISKNAGQYFQECRRRGSGDNEDAAISRIQIRFTSSTEYVVEVVCARFELNPILVSSHTLPSFVTKAPGQAGLIWGEERSGVGLSVFGRTRALYIENRAVSYGSYVPEQMGLSPISSCEGNGFACCPADSTVGMGSQLTSVTNCPKTCYSSCTVRPTVLAVTTEPFMDVQTRMVTVAAGEQVAFTAVTDIGAAESANVTIEFGDGQSEQGTVPRYETSHAYACAKAECVYEVLVSLVDNNGVASALTPVSKVTVTVTGGG